MTLQRELDRFEAVLTEVIPEAARSLGPGLGEHEIAELRRACAPFGLGHDVEQMYRWHNGSTLPIFGGKRFLTAAEIIRDREFQIDVLRRPPAWLQFTDGPEFLVATLNVPDCPANSTVWSGDTHDAWLCLMHDSLESMIGSLNDMARDPSESLERRRELLLIGSRFGGDYRLKRSPGTFTHPNPPQGTYIMLFDAGTPEAWLRSLGTSSRDLEPTGATTTIAELRAAARSGNASGTIQGLTTQVAGSLSAIGFTLDDGTGAVRLTANDTVTKLGPVSQTLVEADVTVTEDGIWLLHALRRWPGSVT